LKLFLDEMYSPRIAEQLSSRAYDALSVADRADLRALPDRMLFERMQDERRTVLTNNVKDFVPLITAAETGGSSHYGVLFTSDRSLPRGRDNIGSYVEVLAGVFEAHPSDDDLRGIVRWLP